jgi:death-on-curing protein
LTTRFLTLAEVLDLYSRVLVEGGGSSAIRDLGMLESALAQPRATFGGEDLYQSVVEVFLILNGHELSASVDDAEAVVLGVAAGSVSREEFTDWIRRSVVPVGPQL